MALRGICVSLENRNGSSGENSTARFSSGEVGGGGAARVTPAVFRQVELYVPLRGPSLGFPWCEKFRGFAGLAMVWRVSYGFSIRVHSYAISRPVSNDSSALSSQPLIWGALGRIRASFLVSTKPDRPACARIVPQRARTANYEVQVPGRTSELP